MNKNTPDLSSLPLDECHFTFIGEGAANLVFELVIDSGVKLDNNVKAIFQENLLRVPKAGAKTHNHQELQQYWESTISPLFPPSNLVQQRLVKLGGPSVISKLNSTLDKEAQTRRHDFKGTRVANAEYGMLVEDMRAKSPTSSFAIEFKPKWLAQSPNAPSKSLRCRTCAREALRSHTKGKSKNVPCPLDLIVCNDNNTNNNNKNSSIAPASYSIEEMNKALTALLTSLLRTSSPSPANSNPENPDPRLTQWLQKNTLLPSLLNAQVLNDTTGPLDPSSDPEKLALAMTLRDCSVYLRIPPSSSDDDLKQPVEAKLGDMDKKDVERKLSYWRELEMELIRGGYYEGKEVPRQRIGSCVLERGK
ncbi:hypothetical protein QBC43DRAFT_307815 [Cladorrhinum sp. PSN259]|nr:hypothetical protein QBC43DRAFT_307815 [Cladorrhinum sp. PSN259]